MVIFSGCAQNGMGKIDALEGIFMSGVGQLVWLGNGYLNGKIYSQRMKSERMVIKLYLVATQLHEKSGNNIQLNDTNYTSA